MEPLTSKKKVLEQKPLTFAERMYLPAIAKGLSVTISHLFKKRLQLDTLKYKENFQSILEDCIP